jgi:phosphate transport system permease protein
VSSSTAERVAEAPPFLRRGRRRWFDGDLVFRWLASASAVFVFVIAGVFLAALVIPAWPSITRFGFHFLVGREWNPVTQMFAALP